MGKPNDNDTITRTAHDKIKREKNAAVRELENVKAKFDVAVEHNSDLTKILSNMKEDIEKKDKDVEKYKTRYANAKEKLKQLQENMCALQQKAESKKTTIEKVYKAKRWIEEQKKLIRWELDQRKNAFLKSKLREEGIKLRSNHHGFRPLRNYDERRPFEAGSRPYQLSRHGNHYPSHDENRPRYH